MMRRNVAFLGTAVVVVSAVVNVAHTASHAGLHLMSLPGWQLAYIAIVIYAAPVVAASLLWTRHRFAGAYLEVTRMRKKFLEFPLPGKTARAMRGGALTCPENRYGRIRWEEFLRKATVGNPGLRR